MTQTTGVPFRPRVPRGPMVVLQYAIPPERRGALHAFFASAFPFYESPGGIRMALYEDLDQPGRFVEIAAYADRVTYDADQQRVAGDPAMRATLDAFRSVVGGPISVVRVAPVEIRPSESENLTAAAPAGVVPVSGRGPVATSIEAPIETSIETSDLTLSHFGSVEALLIDAGLPVPDERDPAVPMVVASLGRAVVGCAGWERYGDVALLRSVAVRERDRRSGVGRLLVLEVLARLARAGVREIYLFTVSASPFFARLGFEPVARESAPESVRQSRQFSMHCCGDATLMRLRPGSA